MKITPICCITMREAIRFKGAIPINIDQRGWPYGIEFYFNEKCDFLDEDPYDIIIHWCPFCGKNLSDTRRRRRSEKYSKGLCQSMEGWFVDGDFPFQKGMIEYNHKNNSFYIRNRKGFDGYTKINYCTICGENLSDMVAKYGLPEIIKQNLHSDEWWEKYGL